MTKDILFYEKQRFNQWWIWILLTAVNGLFLFGLYKQLVLKEQFGNRPMSNEGIVLAVCISAGITWLFSRASLETKISKDGVTVRFFPFHLGERNYPWHSIAAFAVREYNPITEYGGWGLRLGFFGKGNALNVSGNKGLQLKFKNGKKLLIGTQRPEELATILIKIGQPEP